MMGSVQRQVLGLFCSLLIIAGSSVGWTQTQPMGETRRSMATIIFAGLGGAVLGLSTLSFYGEPEEHINNIWTGLALGVISGTGYVIYKNSTQASLPPIELPQKYKRAQLSGPPVWAVSFEF